MKKQLIKVALLLAVPFTMLQSCTDDDSKNTAIAPAGSATITGRVTADLVLGNGSKEGAAGVKVTATINTQDLVTNPVSGVTYATKTYEALTDANGNYTLAVDANVKAVAVTLAFPASFAATQTTENGTTRRVLFNRIGGNPSAGSLSNGQAATFDVDYNFTNIDATAKCTVEGDVMYRNDLCKGISPSLDSQVAVVPANTILIATWTDDNGNNREVEVAVTNGKYSFAVETKNAAKTINLTGRKFYSSRKAPSGGNCVTTNDHGYSHAGVSRSVNKGETEKKVDITFN